MTTANQSKVVLEEMKIWCKNKLRDMSLFIPWGVGVRKILVFVRYIYLILP